MFSPIIILSKVYKVRTYGGEPRNPVFLYISIILKTMIDPKKQVSLRKSY